LSVYGVRFYLPAQVERLLGALLILVLAPPPKGA
jgi:hypothetical protein